ncbi:MAG TPA: hypothetical protein VMF29_08055 [Candidatus Edwardsbacteria bacterium]|nr:hypothetical protein [Candidatus Edwardsbacteria bacterium]
MIAKRPTLALAALVAALVLVHGLLLAWLAGGLFQRRFRQDAVGFAALSARPVVDAYQRYHGSGYYKFQELVRGVMRANPELLRLSLLDVGGAVLFDSGELDRPGQRLPAPPVAPPVLAAARGLTVWARTSRDPALGPVLEIVVPHVDEWGRHRYSLRCQVRCRYWNEDQALYWPRAWLAGLACAALGIAAALALAARPGDPTGHSTRA